MASVIQHRKVNIVTLAPGEELLLHCQPRDIAISQNEAGWWLTFIAPDGQVDAYETPYPGYLQALWAAKAAAEFGVD
jgi:hypothetical protein